MERDNGEGRDRAGLERESVNTANIELAFDLNIVRMRIQRIHAHIEIFMDQLNGRISV